VEWGFKKNIKKNRKIILMYEKYAAVCFSYLRLVLGSLFQFLCVEWGFKKNIKKIRKIILMYEKYAPVFLFPCALYSAYRIQYKQKALHQAIEGPCY